MDKINWTAVAAVAFPFVGAFAGNIITKKNIASGWYESLKFPPCRPPNWVFGPVWSYLYASMGYASYLVYFQGGGWVGSSKIPLILYGTQLAFNWAWTPLFFGAHKIKIAFMELLVLLPLIGLTTVSFYTVDKLAGTLLIPYLLWSSFAAYLNYNIMTLNPEKKTD